MLTVKRLMVVEFVPQETGKEAHIRPAALDHPLWGGGGADRLCVAPLDHRADVLQDHVAARALRHAIADLLADDLVLPLVQACGHLRVRDLDRLDRHTALIEERDALGFPHGGRIALPFAALMGADHPLLARCRRLRWGQYLTEPQLLLVLQHPQPLALGAEHLALEPLELMSEGGKLLRERL